MLPLTSPNAKNNDKGRSLVSNTVTVTLASFTPGNRLVVRDKTCVAIDANTQCQHVKKNGYAKFIVLNRILLNIIMQ